MPFVLFTSITRSRYFWAIIISNAISLRASGSIKQYYFVWLYAAGVVFESPKNADYYFEHWWQGIPHFRKTLRAKSEYDSSQLHCSR